ncbi:hypothetical protein HW130_34700 [Streptomyces sp. PKU-EA00015]|uniref:hypothetical protein n=1 Tax=Streptomyces sp. PKU-EA00015 TaxID=2748326 RepID=UPI0015A00287|nr:hypothetical protein [Streptomyces sp. PKU-EA00015]NWF31308.1 hypothetical protein [Streptomyces sp. PKU-EA00015]
MTLLETQHVDAHVDYFGLSLQDADDGWLPAMFPEGFTQGPFLSEQPGRVDFTSAGHTQTVSFDAEIWSGPPPVPDGVWDESATARIECRSGELRLWAVAGGPAPQGIVLPHASATWNVRVHCRGRVAAAEACLVGVPHGVEQYLAQFWPV